MRQQTAMRKRCGTTCNNMELHERRGAHRAHNDCPNTYPNGGPNIHSLRCLHMPQMLNAGNFFISSHDGRAFVSYAETGARVSAPIFVFSSTFAGGVQANRVQCCQRRFSTSLSLLLRPSLPPPPSLSVCLCPCPCPPPFCVSVTHTHTLSLSTSLSLPLSFSLSLG